MSPLALSLRFLQTQSDARLAALARDGHERAFEALVRRYRRQLLTYCQRVGSVGSNAEDTLQQALLQAWSAIRSGAEVRDPRAWLYRIVHNVAVSDQRRPVVIPVELRDTVGATGADDEAEQRMAARDALAGLAALPHLQREVMVGTAVDGMSHEEVASALGLSSGAVRGLIYRARAALRAAAAAITPGPVISWALRGGSGPGVGLYETLAGGGSAGIGGLLVKGGAIAVTAGAIATATGISTGPEAARHRSRSTAAPVQHRIAERPGITAAASRRLLISDRTGSRVAVHRGSGRPDPKVVSTRHGSDRDGSDNEFVPVSEKHGPHGRPDGSDSGGSRRGDRGGTSATAGGRRSGSDGSDPGSGSSGSRPSSGSGSSPGGSGSGSGLASGSGGPDGSPLASGSTMPSGGSTSNTAELPATDGGSSGDGSGSGETLSASGPTVATVSSDGGGAGSSHDGGMTTTTSSTATSSRDGSSDPGHPDAK